MKQAFNELKNETTADLTIENYVSNWNFCVNINTWSYAFECLVRINDFIKNSDAKEKPRFLNHSSSLVRNIAREIEEHGEASFSFIRSMWDNRLTSTAVQSRPDRFKVEALANPPICTQFDAH